MKKSYLLVAFLLLLTALLLLAACGSTPSDEPVTWKGGHYAEWWPAQPKAIVILHQGHNAFDGGGVEEQNLIPLAEAFRYHGFAVIGFEMPPLPHDGIPLEDFTRPVVEYLDGLDRDEPVFMVGLSGGGWTTTLVTAQDGRIRRGYSVAGDLPLDMRSPADMGDAEQLVPDYRALYAQAGERLLHVFNEYDPCCFAGVRGDIGGEYLLDTGNRSHSIGPDTVAWIVADMDARSDPLIQ